MLYLLACHESDLVIELSWRRRAYICKESLLIICKGYFSDIEESEGFPLLDVSN